MKLSEYFNAGINPVGKVFLNGDNAPVKVMAYNDDSKTYIIQKVGHAATYSINPTVDWEELHMRKFKIEPFWYGEDFRMYKKKTITLEEGVTVLVGCNGIGKTTLLEQLKVQLNKKKIPVLSFDNLHEGGSKSMSSAAFNGDWAFAATAMASSEGENIVMNMGQLARILRHFIETGEVVKQSERIHRAFAKAMWGDKAEPIESKERWILLDAIDSGLSVDNVVDIKEQLFKTIMEVKGDKEVYIVVSANEYEMVRGEQCFDVYGGKYVKLRTYEAYRKFILKSREIKDQRYAEEALNENA